MNWNGVAGEATLTLRVTSPVPGFRGTAGSVLVFRAVERASDAIAILADERLGFAPPALLAWAGNDLVLLRDRRLARNRMVAEIRQIGAPPKRQLEQ